MNLYHDKEAFEELIIGAANELSIPTNVIEKDYYVTITLKALAETYDLMPFEITTQTIERTLVDKVFALCDYYMDDKIERHSRHLYDVYKIVESIGIQDELAALIPEVRAVRAEMPVCPSAKPEVCVSKILHEIIERQAYRNDYEDITLGLLFVPETYDTVIQSLQEIADSKMWE